MDTLDNSFTKLMCRYDRLAFPVEIHSKLCPIFVREKGQTTNRNKTFPERIVFSYSTEKFLNKVDHSLIRACL